MTQTVSLSPDKAGQPTSVKVGEPTQVLTLDGECDLPAALEAEQWIAEALDAGTTKVVADLRGVTSLGASMLQVLLRGLILTKMQKRRFVLVRPNAYVWTLFEQRGLDRAFSSFPDLEAALAETPVPAR
jgi:anti-anti-sigma factor